jgi:hypothetical protein
MELSNIRSSTTLLISPPKKARLTARRKESSHPDSYIQDEENHGSDFLESRDYSHTNEREIKSYDTDSDGSVEFPVTPEYRNYIKHRIRNSGQGEKLLQLTKESNIPVFKQESTKDGARKFLKPVYRLCHPMVIAKPEAFSLPKIIEVSSDSQERMKLSISDENLQLSPQFKKIKLDILREPCQSLSSCLHLRATSTCCKLRTDSNENLIQDTINNTHTIVRVIFQENNWVAQHENENKVDCGLKGENSCISTMKHEGEDLKNYEVNSSFIPSTAASLKALHKDRELQGLNAIAITAPFTDLSNANIPGSRKSSMFRWFRGRKVASAKVFSQSAEAVEPELVDELLRKHESWNSFFKKRLRNIFLKSSNKIDDDKSNKEALNSISTQGFSYEIAVLKELETHDDKTTVSESTGNLEDSIGKKSHHSHHQSQKLQLAKASTEHSLERPDSPKSLRLVASYWRFRPVLSKALNIHNIIKRDSTTNIATISSKMLMRIKNLDGVSKSGILKNNNIDSKGSSFFRKLKSLMRRGNTRGNNSGPSPKNTNHRSYLYLSNPH